MEKLLDGLVYKVQHDRTGYVHNTSVTRMIPVPSMVVAKDASTFLCQAVGNSFIHIVLIESTIEQTQNRRKRQIMKR